MGETKENEMSPSTEDENIAKSSESTKIEVKTDVQLQEETAIKVPLSEHNLETPQKRKLDMSTIKTPLAKRRKSLPTSPETEEELEKCLKGLYEELARRSSFLDSTSEEYDDNKKALVRFKRKFKEDQESIEGIESKNNDLKEALKILKNEEKQLRQKKRQQTKKQRLEISKIESEIRELKRQVRSSAGYLPRCHRRSRKRVSKYKAINLPPHLKPCDTILRRLDRLEHIYIFDEPVDVSKYPDYSMIIKKPMSLEQVRKKLYEVKYSNIHEFAKDVRLIWANARTYNPAINPVHCWAKQYSGIFESLYKRASPTSAALPRKPEFKNAKLAPAEVESLQNELSDLPSNSMRAVVDFLRKECPQKYHNNEITIDLDSIPPNVILKLKILVSKENKLKPKNRRQKRQRLKREIKTLQASENGFKPPPAPPLPYLPTWSS